MLNIEMKRGMHLKKMCAYFQFLWKIMVVKYTENLIKI